MNLMFIMKCDKEEYACLYFKSRFETLSWTQHSPLKYIGVRNCKFRTFCQVWTAIMEIKLTWNFILLRSYFCLVIW